MEARSDPGTRAPVRARAEHLGPERRRPLVLDAALRLVAARGATATTMEAIAAEAGVTKPVVYACYPSKGELMSALLRREERRLADHLRGSLPASAGADVEATLATGFRTFLSAVAKAPDAYRLIFTSELGAGSSVQRAVERARTAQTERIAGLVREGMSARGVDDAAGKALVVASVVVGASEGAVKLLLADPEGWAPEELAELLAGLLARGLEGLGLT